MTFISVIIPTYNEEKFISRCIDSIVQQDFPKEKMEVFFVDGNSSDRTMEIIDNYSRRFNFIRLLNNPKRFVPFAMNIGIRHSKGDFIIRMDAHAEYPYNYFSQLVTSASKLKADNIGGLCQTDVLEKKPKSLAIREVLMNRFGVGNSHFRIGSDKIIEADTVPFGCFKREVFEKFGLYDERLIRNQDIELNKRIKQKGGKIFLIPTIHCTYYARENFKSLFRNNYSNGYWNILTVYYTRSLKSLSIRHFIPLVFVLSLVLPIIASALYFPFILLAIISLVFYLIFFAVLSIKISFARRIHFGFLFYSFLVLHVSYGFGSLVGIFKLPFLKKMSYS